MVADLPRACDIGCKMDSRGRIRSWTGCKLHLDTADGGLPVSGILAPASLYDSQAAVPLAETTAGRVTNLHGLMDSTYDSAEIHRRIRELGRVLALAADQLMRMLN